MEKIKLNNNGKTIDVLEKIQRILIFVPVSEKVNEFFDEFSEEEMKLVKRLEEAVLCMKTTN